MRLRASKREGAEKVELRERVAVVVVAGGNYAKIYDIISLINFVFEILRFPQSTFM